MLHVFVIGCSSTSIIKGNNTLRDVDKVHIIADGQGRRGSITAQGRSIERCK